MSDEVKVLAARAAAPDVDDERGAGGAELVGAVARRDEGEWDDLMDQYGTMIVSIARSKGLNASDVADVVQTVWLKLLEHIDRIRDPERVRGWLATTTRHECAGVWRQRQRVTLLRDPGRLHLVADERVEPRVETRDRDVQLRAAVATLPAIQQAIVGRLMSDGAPSYSQVADDLGIPIGSIGPTRRRCLQLLRAKCVLAGIGPG